MSQLELPPHPLLSEIVRIDISHAARDAYGFVSAEFHIPLDEVHRSPRCHIVAGIMMGRLQDRYRVSQPVAYCPENNPVMHSYLVRSGWRGDLIIDPTWQQFLDDAPPPADEPKVMVGTRKEVLTKLMAHGVGETALKLWSLEAAGEQEVSAIQRMFRPLRFLIGS